MAHTAAVLLILLAVPSVALVTKTEPKVHPADATTIAGVDCNHVKSIIGKWTKSTKVGTLLGAAKATIDAGNQAATNADAAADSAEQVGLKVGENGTAPSSVADAVAVARAASTDVSTKALTLQGTFDSTKAAMSTEHFAEDVSNAAITQITTETEDVVVATADVNIAATRATKKAEEAKAAALKNTKGTLKMIKGVVSDIAQLSKKVKAMEQRINFATKDVSTSLGKADANGAFMKDELLAYINDATTGAGEQAPVWQAHHDAIMTLAETLTTDMNVVNEATVGKLAIMSATLADMTAEETTLKGVVDAAQSSESAALGQAENIAKAEETLRTATTAFDICKNAVLTMMKAKKRLDAKVVDIRRRLTRAPRGGSR